jgi:hypothetical protein
MIALLSSVLIVFPLPKGDVISIPDAPSFPAAGQTCESIAPDFSGPASMTANVDAHSTTIIFTSFINGFLFNGDHRSGKAGYLYVRLDDQPATYLSVDETTQPTSVNFVMTGLTEGSHHIDFALLSIIGVKLPYGRICFDVKAGSKKRFTFDLYHIPGHS